MEISKRLLNDDFRLVNFVTCSNPDYIYAHLPIRDQKLQLPDQRIPGNTKLSITLNRPVRIGRHGKSCVSGLCRNIDCRRLTARVAFAPD